MGCDIHGYLEVRKYANVSKVWSVYSEIPDDRDYDWFGIIAGVRNYVNAPPISLPRGVPSDVSEKAGQALASWGFDGHSHSWLTLDDFDNYDWEQESIDGRVSTVVKETGEEQSKASYTWLMDQPQEKLDELGVELKYLSRKMHELVSYEWMVFLNFMRGLADVYGRENVRIVFWFDS